ncbi:hypothetical protein BpHYR1_041303 [Brachionus plicatilis]|uniref:Uncharacterized protein n=1 Tax=Brachionus plicatilis TaxID=10195 RepID=A0A3M7R641_BRAPC|nr:hypothetical protein BpHYR1_041303 [Brachionus plicatilis]
MTNLDLTLIFFVINFLFNKKKKFVTTHLLHTHQLLIDKIKHKYKSLVSAALKRDKLYKVMIGNKVNTFVKK